ncbi:MAG: hypothetical protein KUL86_12590 [Castellaniella sp.]|nr:hypothetical protein [Castellaniella sp.]
MKEWGDWQLVDKPQFMLVNKEQGYEISFSDMHGSAAVLDWIFQLHGKLWMSPKSMHDLLSALSDILEPQANYCSMGQDQPADGVALAKRYWENPDPFGLA